MNIKKSKKKSKKKISNENEVGSNEAGDADGLEINPTKPRASANNFDNQKVSYNSNFRPEKMWFNVLRSIRSVRFLLSFLIVVLCLYFFKPFWIEIIDGELLNFRLLSKSELVSLNERMSAIEENFAKLTQENDALLQFYGESKNANAKIMQILSRLHILDDQINELKKSLVFENSAEWDEISSILKNVKTKTELLEKTNKRFNTLRDRLGKFKAEDFESLMSKVRDGEMQRVQLVSDIKRIQRQLGVMQKPIAINANQSHIRSKILLINQLIRAIESGTAFTHEFSALLTSLDKNDEIRNTLLSVEENSQEGALTNDMLQTEFSNIKNELIRLSTDGAEESKLYDQIFRELSSLIKIRKLDGENNNKSIISYVYNVETYLRQEKLDEALEYSLLIRNDYPKTEKLMQQWIAQLEASILTRRLISSLQTHAETIANNLTE